MLVQSQRLIMINGFAGVGKTTIAKKYIDNHPLSFYIEGDEMIVKIGQWATFEKEAREYIFELTQKIADTYLSFGKTVIIPYLLVNADHAEAFENIAEKHTVPFLEIFLSTNKLEAINRLMERGSWGEPGLPPIIEKDLPIIQRDYDIMTRETAKRTKTKEIYPVKNDVEKTYKLFLEAIGE